MPSKSPRQARLMRLAARDVDVAKVKGIPQRVAREFVAADKRKAGHPKTTHRRR